MPVISIVSPVYRGEKMVHELVCRIQKNVSGFTEDYEIILVNDASPDNSWQAILQECSIDHRIKGINLSRNFGQHRAILSGLQYAKGDWVIVMDCDLQDKPEEISTLYKKALEGYDVVFAQRVERKDNLLKRMSSTIFYSVFRFLSGVKFDNQVANFGIYKQSVIRTVRNMPERDRSFPVQVSYVGFKTTHIPVTHGQRQEGGSSYTLKTLLKYASGIIISNTNKPMRLMVALGFILSFLSMMMAFYNVIAYFCHMIEVPGFTTTVFSIWFVGGMIMMQIGIVGIYIGKVFDQVKGRPLYVVMDEVNIDKES
jgi:dolichol-phosphate mannosyltransferase